MGWHHNTWYVWLVVQFVGCCLATKPLNLNNIAKFKMSSRGVILGADCFPLLVVVVGHIIVRHNIKWERDWYLFSHDVCGHSRAQNSLTPRNEGSLRTARHQVAYYTYCMYLASRGWPSYTESIECVVEQIACSSPHGSTYIAMWHTGYVLYRASITTTYRSVKLSFSWLHDCFQE